ncbi:MAG: 16S rRNA (uracil(1498)-N(3))-methyltransferase [Ignavibacteria bacterium]|nr:16S rRNA (uracil(1498)-N(3))-methyltransferase [Ignavibacteria bacterium]
MEYYVYDKISIKQNKIIIDDIGLVKHLYTVLRKKVGDIIEITDGKGNLFKGKVIIINKYRIELEVLNIEKNKKDVDVNLTLFLCQLRNISRFEFAVEKSVELGVSRIIPVITENTVSKSPLSENRINRLRSIIKSATGQSQRTNIPEICSSIFLKDINKYAADGEKIVMYEFAEYENNIELKFENYKINLLIGPEGGFDEKEIEFLVKNNWRTYSLGKRKIRAETAAIISVYEIINHSKIKK